MIDRYTKSKRKKINIIVNSNNIGEINNNFDFKIDLINTLLNEINPTSVNLNNNILILNIPDGELTLKNSNGDTLRILNVVADGSDEDIIGDVIIQLKDSDGNDIGSPQLFLAESIDDIIAPDGTLNVQKSDNALISAQTIRSGQTTSYNVADSVIENSDASYSVNVLATDGLILPDVDIDILDQSNNVIDTDTIPSVKNHTIDVFQYCPPAIFDLDLVDRFGNAFPTKQVSANATWDLRTLTPFDYADLYLSRLTNPPTGAQEAAVIDYFVDAVSAGIFQGAIKIELDIGGNAADHAWNARYPFDNNHSMKSLYVGSPTHDANGVSLNGSSQYVRTNAYANYLNDFNKEVAIYVRSCPYKDGQYIFNAGNGFTAQGYTYLQSTDRNRWATEGPIIAPNTLAILGLNSIGRDSATTMYMKRNNVHTPSSPHTDLAGAYNRVSEEITLGAILNKNLTAAAFAEMNYSYLRIGDSLNDSQQAAHYSIVQALQTAFSRQV